MTEFPRRTEPLLVKVITYEIDSPEGQDESEKVIDYCNDSDRKWLGKHAFWALANGRAILQEPM